MKHLLAVVLTALGLLCVSACGGGPGISGSGSAGGPDRAMTVADALSTDADGPLRVRGALLHDGKVAKLCDGLAESYPPQCINGVTIDGFDTSIIPPSAASEGQLRWVERIELIVTRDGRNFRYVSTAETA